MSRLAAETFVIMLGGQSVELVPSLRAAMRLARRYGSYRALFGKILEGDLEAIADVITDGSTASPLFLQAVERQGVLATIAPLQATLLDFIGSLTGHDPEAPVEAKTKSKTVNSDVTTITDLGNCRQLFEVATGQIGWSPVEAWAATPMEIRAAHAGLMAKLQMIYGSREKAEAKDTRSLGEKARSIFGALVKRDADERTAT